MSIKDFILKIKPYLINVKSRIYNTKESLKINNDLFIVFLIILVGTASFGLGKLSALEKKKVPISVLKTEKAIVENVNVNQSASKVSIVEQKGIIVASKSGTKYYYPLCSGVARIKEENKVWYSSIKEAESVGLTLAANCSPN